MSFKKTLAYLSLSLIASISFADSPPSLLGTWKAIDSTTITTESIQQSHHHIKGAITHEYKHDLVVEQQTGNHFLGYIDYENNDKKLKNINHNGHQHLNKEKFPIMGVISPLGLHDIYLVPQEKYPAHFTKCVIVSMKAPAKMNCFVMSSGQNHSAIAVFHYRR